MGTRNTTSKIARLEDLDRIETHGFRGEALANIADVSCLKIETQADQSPAASKLLRYGKTELLSQSSDRDKRGTTVTVDELFGNVPVRQKAANHEKILLQGEEMKQHRRGSSFADFALQMWS